MKALVLVLTLIISLEAAHAQAPAPLTAESVAKMECSDASDALKARLLLFQQLSQAFLQSNHTLEDVYKTWSERLTQVKDPVELAQVAEFFRKSAETLNKARAQNEQMITSLNQEAGWLSSRASWCAGAPIEAEIIASRVELIQARAENVKLRVLGFMPVCDRFDGQKIERAGPNQYNVRLISKRYRCQVSGNLPFDRIIDLGPLAAGQQLIHFYGDLEKQSYFLVPVDVKP